MFDHETAEKDDVPIRGLASLPVSWFYMCLLGVVCGWVLSLAELVCLFYFGRPK